MWRVASYTNLEITLLSSRVRTYAGTNRAGCQNTPVTLRDSPNEGGSDVRVTTDSTVCAFGAAMRRIEMRRFDNFDDDALPRLVRRQNRALSCPAPTSGWTWKAGALTSYIYCIIKSHAPSSTFQLTFFAPQSFRLFPPCSLSFGSRSFPFSRSFPHPLRFGISPHLPFSSWETLSLCSPCQWPCSSARLLRSCARNRTPSVSTISEHRVLSGSCIAPTLTFAREDAAQEW
jgi:hypothetical protein